MTWREKYAAEQARQREFAAKLNQYIAIAKSFLANISEEDWKKAAGAGINPGPILSTMRSKPTAEKLVQAYLNIYGGKLTFEEVLNGIRSRTNPTGIRL